MSEPVSREEMNARLDAAEARREMRFVQLDAKSDTLVGKIDASGSQMAEVRADAWPESRPITDPPGRPSCG